MVAVGDGATQQQQQRDGREIGISSDGVARFRLVCETNRRYIDRARSSNQSRVLFAKSHLHVGVPIDELQRTAVK